MTPICTVVLAAGAVVVVVTGLGLVVVVVTRGRVVVVVLVDVVVVVGVSGLTVSTQKKSFPQAERTRAARITMRERRCIGFNVPALRSALVDPDAGGSGFGRDRAE
jgi:hypothetical protein